MRELTDVPTIDLTAFLDEVEENGVATEVALDALAHAHDLDDDELEAVRAELAERGVRVADEPEADETELDLSFDLVAGGVPDSLTLLMNDVGRWPLLTAAQEVELAKHIERGDHQAKERMINSNLRLVIHNAKRYAGHGVPLGDLVQEGVIGLNRAAEKFDWRKGFKFSTYATWWIRQSCQRAVANQSKTIRLPVHVDERRTKLARVRQQFEIAHGRPPTLEELAKAGGLSERHAQEALNAVEVSASLNQRVGDDATELGDLFVDPEADDPEAAAITLVRNVEVRRALETLGEPHRRIVELRFGMDGEPMGLEAVGRELGISRETVRQLEGEALEALAEELEGLATAGPNELASAA